MLRPTRAASSVMLRRPSCWSAARILRSTASMGWIIPPSAAWPRILGNTFGQLGDSFLLVAVFEGEPSMALSSIAAFWAVALLLIIVPGADWAFIIGTVLGGRPVLPAVGGIVLGYAGMTVVVAAGVGAVVASTPASLTALTLAGGL